MVQSARFKNLVVQDVANINLQIQMLAVPNYPVPFFGNLTTVNSL